MDEEITVDELAEAIAEETGVDIETAKVVLMSFGHYVATCTDENDEFDIPIEEFEDLNEGC